MHDAVCFDMDGVIVNSEHHWVPLENERILPEAAPDGDVTASDVIGMHVGDIYDFLVAEHGTTMDREAFLTLYDDAAEELYTERADLLPGFEALCSALRERDASLALVSSSSHRWIRFVTDRFGLDAFDAVVSADDVEGPSKPDPFVYEYAASELDVPADACVAVEDSTHGVAAANAAAMSSVGFRWDDDHTQDLSAADVVTTGPEELRRALLDRV
ncbi:HAD family hydrolase [Halomarina oriensis]|uniref:HAD-IA family hydrolase n=1 Tax=Halomarina oriensis TaxID=671145 RepID=A0A6B0GXW8_9EURY|nr:HAD family phosphatase [Halomarina oriensis]MWG36628.1 HAD-IA family hydrolase [Halomarina oriensis]